MRYRVIPVLLLRGAGLVKTERFKDAKYVGDPVNAVRIFNDKEVDELVFLDIEATVNDRSPDLEMLRNIAGECFMPLCYGGGVRDLPTIEAILKTGVEKVAVNSALVENPEMIREAARIHGSSTIVASIDFKRCLFGNAEAVVRSGRKKTKMDPVELARRAEDLGVGEILLNSIDRDGTMQGYDLEITQRVADAVKVPVIACGGAGSLAHFHDAIHKGHSSAVAAGAFFVFVGKHRAVLITYPAQEDLKRFVFRS
ncbi:MAG TPA: AglZ/HisF2 family acetamidino modification protein [Verrucomicrobiales bacterium]|jgi:cyclase|nr:AglZ/HisF2 family acetamidino modification protein [Verrucomicrobiales bacterium]